MKVLVDTCIWSYALRSKNKDFAHYIQQLESLIIHERIAIIGAIKQELLSGYTDTKKFETLENRLNAFQNEVIFDEDYIQAAHFYNTCRKNGIQGSHIDMLICSVSVRLDVEIFTTDKDFEFYQHYLPIKLHGLKTH